MKQVIAIVFAVIVVATSFGCDDSRTPRMFSHDADGCVYIAHRCDDALDAEERVRQQMARDGVTGRIVSGRIIYAREWDDFDCEITVRF